MGVGARFLPSGLNRLNDYNRLVKYRSGAKMTIFEPLRSSNLSFILTSSNITPPHARAIDPVSLSGFGIDPATQIEPGGQNLGRGGCRAVIVSPMMKTMDLAWNLSPDGRGRGFCLNQNAPRSRAKQAMALICGLSGTGDFFSHVQISHTKCYIWNHI